MKKLISKLWNWIEGLFSKLESKVRKMTPIAVNIVEIVKNTVENQKFIALLEVIKFSIPGDADDKLIDKIMETVQKYIPKIALQLDIIQSISGLETVNEQMIAVVNALKQASDDQKSDYWHELAAFILRQLADGELTLGEAGAIVEYHYQNYVKK